jgi:hypothetical protein
MFPDSIIVKTFDITSRKNVVSSESRNLISLTRALSGQRWDCRFRIDVKPWNVNAALGFLMALQEDDANVEYTDPTWVDDVSNVGVSSAASSGALNVTLSSVADVYVGKLLNFSNHSKLYMVTAINGSAVRLNARLVSAVTTSHTAILNNPSVLLELAPDLKGGAQFSSRLMRELSSFNLRMQEVLR